MIHSFDTDIAAKYGIEEAILIQNFAFWISKNEANGVHFYDGRFWTYNSLPAIFKLFPEFKSIDKTKRIVKKLIDNGILMRGNYNKSEWDKTSWYAFTEKGIKLVLETKLSMAETYIVDSAEINHRQCKNTRHTDNNIQIDTTDNNTPYDLVSTPIVVDTKSFPQGECESSPQIEEVSNDELTFEKFRKVYRGTKRGLKTEFENFKKKHKDWKEVLKTLQACYEHQCELKDEARKKGCFVPQEKNLQTYINQRCWEEEPQFAPNKIEKKEPTLIEKLQAIEQCRKEREAVEAALDEMIQKEKQQMRNENDYEPF